MSNVKGEERERSLQRSEYFSSEYFKLPQLCSLAQQLHDVYKLYPDDILEVGIGNGFLSTLLKRTGFDVVTVDINRELDPDICAPIHEMHAYLNGRVFDLVVCCEVLEHIPFDEFDQNLKALRAVCRRLYLTLPNYENVFGVGGFLNVLKVSPIPVDARIEFPGTRKLDKAHFWEVGSSPKTVKREITRIIRTYFKTVNTSRYLFNSYHVSFYAFD